MKAKSINESTNNIRSILPTMVGVSNNSQLTNMVANYISDNLTSIEFENFRQWLKIIEHKIIDAERSPGTHRRYY
jgi:hypothetical protein